VRILQWEMTHDDPLFKALNMSLLLLLCGCVVSFYVIYINYVVV
jgi:hypothetical protein